MAQTHHYRKMFVLNSVLYNNYDTTRVLIGQSTVLDVCITSTGFFP